MSEYGLGSSDQDAEKHPAMNSSVAGFEFLMAVKLMMFFWFSKPCRPVGRYQLYGENIVAFFGAEVKC
jgi:hypothetical protein